MRRIPNAVVAILAVTSMNLLAQTGGAALRITREVPLAGKKAIGLHETTARGFAIGLTGASGSEVEVYERSGNRRWSVKIPADLIGVEAASTHLLAAAVEPRKGQDTGLLRAHVLDAQTGQVVRRFQAPHGSELTISKAGDAVVTYPNSMEEPGKTLRIRRVEGGESRTITVDGTIGAVIALDYDRVVILLENGRLDYFNRDARVWSRPIKRVNTATQLQVSSQQNLALVGLPGGAYVLVDLIDGTERYRYSPSPAEQALASLKLLDDARAMVKGRDQERRLARLAANFKATLLENGELVFEPTVEDPVLEVRVRPLIGQTERMDRLANIRAQLEARGVKGALRQNPRARGGARRFTFLSDSSGAAIVENGSLFILSR